MERFTYAILPVLRGVHRSGGVRVVFPLKRDLWPDTKEPPHNEKLSSSHMFWPSRSIYRSSDAAGELPGCLERDVIWASCVSTHERSLRMASVSSPQCRYRASLWRHSGESSDEATVSGLVDMQFHPAHDDNHGKEIVQSIL